MVTHHIPKVLARRGAFHHGSRKMTPKAWHSNMRSWSEPDRPPGHFFMLLIAALAIIWNVLGPR
jgi:hypothetical protein